MHIILLGVNHRTAPVELRERVAFTAEHARRAAQEHPPGRMRVERRFQNVMACVH